VAVHIAFVATPDLSYVSGSSLSLRYTVEALGRRGAHSTVLCQRAPAGPAAPLVDYRELPMPLDYQVITDTRPTALDLASCVTQLVAALVALDDVDVVHAVYGTFTGVAASIGGALLGVPVVITTFGRDLHVGATLDDRYRELMRIAYGNTDLVVAADDALALAIGRDYCSTRAEVCVLPPGMNFTILRDAQRRQRVDGGFQRALAVQSSFNEKKGLALLLEAFATVHTSIPAATLVIAGHDDTPDGRIDARLRATVAHLGLERNVEFVGHLTHQQVVDLMTSCQVFVDPRTINSFSSCVYEAMAVGLPVVASDVACNRAALDGGRHGVLTRAGDVGSLAEGILRVLGDPQLAGRLVETGVAYAAIAAERLDCDVIAENLLARYKNLIETRASSTEALITPKGA
jgi:glycosyltransferase involved in cell wall biosynthesis